MSAVLTNACGIGAGLAMHAFLITSIGAGTTVANEIASVSFNLSPGLQQNVSLFSGLTLGPGNCFLVMQMDGGTTGQGGWAVAIPTVVTDTGVTRVGDRFASTAAGYAPASVTNLINNAQHLRYSVESVENAVPEPSTAALVLTAGFGLVLGSRTRRR
ncbi:MAG: PEP-CTERM sorting domain-containing protein [Bryobacterales bacterium]|nr:PEP-CTERM sorting domain-containing protein [Bryobacterales bacterium]